MTAGVSRLAPSPTGAQHLGNARTFLIAFWAARSSGATLLLRIEDIDSPRIKLWATQQAIDDLSWLGIHWDGVPLIQTERTARYNEILDCLRCNDRIYPCRCTRRDIELAASAPHDDLPGGEGPVYPGTCAGWKIGDPIADPSAICWRFRMRPGVMTFQDRVAGTIEGEPTSMLGDFPVTRKGGDAAYQLAVVVDDIDSQVTDVVRGDDLIFSTFRQMQLYQAIGQSPPKYAHLPLVVGTDGRRLAKRHGDTRLSHYREQGIAPERIVAWAASTSGLADDIEEFRKMSMTEIHKTMIDRFDWSRINRDRVVIDTDHDTI